MSRATPRFVYVASSDSGPHKIGVSDRPLDRMKQLWFASRGDGQPSAVELIAVKPRCDGSAKLVEKVAHSLLRAKQIEGEWFDVTAAEAIAGVEHAVHLVETGQHAEHNGGANMGTTIRLPDTFWQRVDEWRRRQQDLPSRPEALRRLAERTLDADEPEKKPAPKKPK